MPTLFDCHRMQPLVRIGVGLGAVAAPRNAIREAVGKREVAVVVLPGYVALQAAADAPPTKVAGLLPAPLSRRPICGASAQFLCGAS